jgi:hypothetical protein
MAGSLVSRARHWLPNRRLGREPAWTPRAARVRSADGLVRRRGHLVGARDRHVRMEAAQVITGPQGGPGRVARPGCGRGRPGPAQAAERPTNQSGAMLGRRATLGAARDRLIGGRDCPLAPVEPGRLTNDRGRLLAVNCQILDSCFKVRRDDLTSVIALSPFVPWYGRRFVGDRGTLASAFNLRCLRLWALQLCERTTEADGLARRHVLAACVLVPLHKASSGFLGGCRGDCQQRLRETPDLG